MDAPAMQRDATLMRSQTDRENPFNKFECDAEINENELLQQIKGCETSASYVSVDKQTLSHLGIDLSAERSLEHFVHHFDDTVSSCFKLESDETKRRSPPKGVTTSDHNVVAHGGQWHARLLWQQLLLENARTGVHGWHKPFATQLYLRSLLKQRQRVAESEAVASVGGTSRLGASGAAEWTKALLDTRRRSRYDEQCSETDENELRACFDLHSLITAELPAGFGEPFKSADEVLAEIDQLIQEGAGVCALEGDANISPTALELLHFKEHGGSTSAELESSLRSLSIGALSGYLEELEVLIRHLSEQLVQELAEREEIDLERELKSEFISLITAVHKQQKEAASCNVHAHANNTPTQDNNNSSSSSSNGRGSKHVSSKSVSLAQHTVASVVSSAAEPASPLSRLRKISWSTSNVGAPCTPTPNAQLFMQIPYHASHGAPDCELLQRFNLLLRAIVDNHAAVPQLLTDYILNVYAPPSVDVQASIKLK